MPERFNYHPEETTEPEPEEEPVMGKNRFNTRAAKTGASWGLDRAKGYAIDAMAAGAVVAGPIIMPEGVVKFVHDNPIVAIGATYAVYIGSRAVASWEDIKLQRETGISTNAWGNTAQAVFDKENKHPKKYQAASEAVKAAYDEAKFLLP